MNSTITKPAINLKIENKTSNFLNDQTPTPTTRLIKNCEEVGLFDDLKHVNPFDETFRRAVEESTVSINDNKIPNNNLNLPSSEDTLHTPHITYNDNSDSKDPGSRDFELNKSQLASSKTSSKKKVSDISKNVIKKCAELSLKTNRQIVSEKKLRMLLPKPKYSNIKNIHPQVISVNFHGEIDNTIRNSTRPSMQSTYIRENNCKVSCLIKKKLKSSITRFEKSLNEPEINNQSKINSTCKSVKERKRAASMRYRNKRNKEICELKKRMSELLSENLLFKEQIKQLQHILLTQHSNCSVTKQELEKNPNGNLDKILKNAAPTIHIPSSMLVLNIPKIIIQQTAEIYEKCTEL